MRILFVLFSLAALIGTTGCVHSQTRTTGIPATSAENFYFNMEQVALEKGYSTRNGEPGARELTVTVPGGYLYYGTRENGNGVEVQAAVDKIDNESDSAADQRVEKIWVIHDELLTKARALSQKNETFR